MAETKTFAVAASADDGYNCDSLGGFINNDYVLYMGYFMSSAAPINTFIRFVNVTVPNGSTITSATLRLVGGNANAPTIKVSAEKADNPTAPTSKANLLGRARTTAYKSWTVPIGTSPMDIDITTVVSEVVSRTGWASGNAIQIFLDPAGTVYKYAIASSFDDGTPVNYPSLIVTYTESGGSPAPTITVQSYDKSTISDESGMTMSTVVFKSDQGLTQWEARADGNGQGQGLLVGSGGAVTANTEVTFDVDYTELTLGDKTYRINIYGKNASGAWTPYG
jgi:hypothetical protein